jgi:transposase-like protein
MSGFRTSAMPRPLMNSGRPPTPVVMRRVERAEFGTPRPLEIPDDPTRPLWFRKILAEVVAEAGLTNGYRIILGRRRDHKTMQVRLRAYAAVVEAKPHMSIASIARLFDRNHTTLLSGLGRLAKYQKKGYAPQRLGEASPHSRISDEDARALAALGRGPERLSARVLGLRFGIGKTAAGEIIRGKRRDRTGAFI